MMAPVDAVVIVRPVKKSAKGILPPMTPIKTSFIQSCFVNFLNDAVNVGRNRNPDKTMATNIFFSVVNTTGSILETKILEKKIEKPEMAAVSNASWMPLFMVRCE